VVQVQGAREDQERNAQDQAGPAAMRIFDRIEDAHHAARENRANQEQIELAVRHGAPDVALSESMKGCSIAVSPVG